MLLHFAHGASPYGVPGEACEDAARAFEAPARVHDGPIIQQQHVARAPRKGHTHILHHLCRLRDSSLVQVSAVTAPMSLPISLATQDHRLATHVPAVVPACVCRND